MALIINEISEQQVLTSYNFARVCDAVYAEMVTPQQYYKLRSENSFEILNNQNQVLYINSKLNIKENDVIFCNTYLLESLFKLLNQVSNLNNIKILTNQTDHEITENLYRLKPDCVSEWYSVNVGYNSPNLIPIPLGLSNNYSEKNLNKSHFKKINQNIKKEELIYLNFQINTNYLERRKLYKKFINKSYAFVDDPNLGLIEYLNNLNKYKFILAPFGNGIDTHRIWEALYSGSIPVIEEHVTFQTLHNLNPFIVKSFSEINSNLISEFQTIQKIEVEKLTIDWWLKKIIKNKINSNEKIQLSHSIDENLIIKKEYFKLIQKENRIKKIKTIQRKALKKIGF